MGNLLILIKNYVQEMKKLSILFASVFILALTSCKKTVSSNESDKKDTTAVVVDSTVAIDSSNVDSILQKR